MNDTAQSLLERGLRQLQAWHDSYAKAQPDFPPPAGDVRWMEEAEAFLKAKDE